jgi:hypothetical protein
MSKKSFLECIRTPVKSVMLILIFTASFAALCFAVNYGSYVRTNILEVDKSFTTIAVPDIQSIKRSLPDSNREENAYQTVDHTPEANFYLSLRRFAETSEYGRLDSRELLRGVSDSVTPVLSGAFEPLEYDIIADTPRNAAAFIVTAVEIEYASKLASGQDIFKKLSIFSGGGTMDSAHYVVKFRVNEILVLNSSYRTPEFVYAAAGAFTPDLKCPFEYGKQYLISGVYCGVRVIQKERDNGTPLPDYYLDFDDNSVPSIYLDDSNFNRYPNVTSDREKAEVKDIEVNGEATTAYTYSENELSQMCISYDGDLEALLVKRPDIAQRLDEVKINAYSIEIRTTDHLDSVPYFNQGKASVMAGRGFTEEETVSGAPVCVVSERFATFNNLKVGDRFSVDLYNSIMRRSGSNTWEMVRYHDSMNIYLHEREISRGYLTLEIVGIYIAPLWDNSAYSLNDSIIFIPSNAVPVKADITLPEKIEDLERSEQFYFSQYSPHMIPALFTVIIPNDKLEDFKAEAKAAGYGEFFIYNDQGYSQVKDALPLIADSTRIFMAAAFVGFLAVYVLYLALLPRKRRELGMLISLGAKRSEAAMSAVLGWFIILVPSLILCFLTVMFSGAPLAKAALNSTMEQLQYNDAFSVGAQDSVVDLLAKFSNWTNNYMTTIWILSGVLALYLITALAVNKWQSGQPVLKLLGRYE